MSARIAPTPKEAIAVQLHHQGRTMAQIQANTGLDRETILAAVERDAADRQQQPSTPPPAPRGSQGKPLKRPARPVDRDERIRVLIGVIDVLKAQLATRKGELADLLADRTEQAAPAAEPTRDPDPATPTAPVPEAGSSDDIRAWAIAEGWAVPDGQLPGAIVLAYRTAHRGDL